MKGLVDFAQKHLGVSLFPGQRQVLLDWERSGARKALLALGRRSGKSLICSIAAIHNAVVPDYSGCLRPGETRFIIVVGTREQQAREIPRMIRELLANAVDEDLRSLVETGDESQDEVKFINGVVVRAMPCSSRSTRGLATSLLILDECAHMVTTEDGYAAGKQVYRALVPGTAQFGERGYVMLPSTPLYCSGVFWEVYQQRVVGAARDVFVAQKATWECNPTITRESLESEFRSDPESANTEYGASFLEGAGSLLAAGPIQECVVQDRTALPPVPGIRYSAAADPAFAANGDAFTFCIAHCDGRGEQATVVIDRLESWRGRNSPLNSDAVLDDIADLMHEYRIDSVTLDQYAVIPLSDGFRRRGILVKAQALTNELKYEVFVSLKRAINNGRVELLDDPALISELIHLETRPTASGKPRIAGARGSRDDLAMSVATVTHELTRKAGAGSSRLQQGHARAALAAANRPRPPVNDRAFEPTRSSGSRDSWFGSQGDTGWPS